MIKKNLIFDNCQRGKCRRAKIYHWRRVPECKVQPVTAKIEGRQVTDYSLVPNREHDNQYIVEYHKFVTSVVLSFFYWHNCLHIWSAVVECWTLGRRAPELSLSSVTALWSWARQFYPSLVLVPPRKSNPYITERLLTRRKESNKKMTAYAH